MAEPDEGRAAPAEPEQISDEQLDEVTGGIVPDILEAGARRLLQSSDVGLLGPLPPHPLP